MGLLAPLFIAAGVLALAVPIIVHLIHRERSETVVFPSLMFLRRIPYRSARRQKIRHWLLFVLRCLALLLLASAFARPFLSNESRTAAALTGGRELVVLLDRSYSMGYGNHWPRALAAAREAIDAVGPGDRATVILFADDARAANRTTSDRAALRAAVDSAKPGSGLTRYAGALKLARQFLDESPLPRREVVVISDFQRAGWVPDEVTRMPAGTDVRTVNLAEREPANVSVAGVSFQRDFQDGRERVRVSARLSNRGATPVRRLPVKLELSGRELQSQTADIAANGPAGVTFLPFNLPDGVSRGTVRTGPDNLPADNEFHFVLTPAKTVSVLLLEPVGAGTDQSLYIRRSLAVGDQPPFRVDSRRSNQLTRADLNGRSIVVSLDAGVPSGDAGRALADFVNEGGGLIVALGERSTQAAFGPEAAKLLPGRIGPVVDRPTTSGGRLAQVDISHPVFEPFSAPRSGDFSSARFFRYRRVETDTAGAAGRLVLARFDDGAPALLERRVGRGTVLLWTSSLDNFWNDLPLQPVYLPFVHQIAKRGAGYTEAQTWFSVGQAADVTEGTSGTAVAAGVSEREDLVAQTPSGGRTVIPPGTSRALALREQGFYEVRRPGDRAVTRVVAANLDLAEADLTPLDLLEFTASVRPQNSTPGAVGGDAATVTAEDRERRQAIWWYLLIGAFVLLAAETVLSNRLSRVTATT